MNVSVFGLGYVGAVTAACLARHGHTVIGVDTNPDKCERINQGRTPIIEADLEPILRQAVTDGRVRATTDPDEAVRDSEVSIISVGTPSLANGSLDLGFVERVCVQIGQAVARNGQPHVVVLRSTVLPGSTETCAEIIRAHAEGTPVAVAFNPEFLREGSAVHDFEAPPYTVIGTDDPRAEAAVRALYARVDAPVHVVPIRVAEMVKYASNAFHALKVTFANEIGLMAKTMNVDGRAVMHLVAQDTKLNVGPAYLRPGFAYGGSCLPKDVAALLSLARTEHLEVPLLSSLPKSNRWQIERIAARIHASGARKLAVLGLAFKPGTDDLRESPAVELIERLLGKGCQIRILDPAVQTAKLVGANKEYIERKLPHVTCLLTDDLEHLLDGVEAVVLTHNTGAFAGIVSELPDHIKLFDLAGLAQQPDHLQTDGVAW